MADVLQISGATGVLSPVGSCRLPSATVIPPERGDRQTLGDHKNCPKQLDNSLQAQLYPPYLGSHGYWRGPALSANDSTMPCLSRLLQIANSGLATLSVFQGSQPRHSE